MIQVFDDVFCEEEKTNIENFFTSDNIPWYYYDHTGIPSEYDTVKDINTQDSAQFVHNFYSTRLNGINSNIFYKIEELVEELNLDELDTEIRNAHAELDEPTIPMD